MHLQNYGTVFATIADKDKAEALPLNRDDKTNGEAHKEHKGKVSLGGEGRADLLANGQNADVRTDEEEAKPENEQYRARKEAGQGIAQWGDREVEQKHEDDDRYYRDHRFFAFFEKEHPYPLLNAIKSWILASMTRKKPQVQQAEKCWGNVWSVCLTYCLVFS